MHQTIQKWLQRCALMISGITTFPAFADSYDIGGGGDIGGFSLITNFFQKYVDFMTGPFAHAAIAATLIIGIIAWAISPKEGLFGTVVRVVMAGMVALNVATWMGMFGS